MLIWYGVADPRFYRKAPGSTSRGERLPDWFGRLILLSVGLGLLSNAFWRLTH